jgi:hypothetical protein
MDETRTDADTGMDEFLKVREPGAHLEAEASDVVVLDIEMDTDAFHIYPRVDDDVVYRVDPDNLDVRADVTVDNGLDLPDYSGPWRKDLRFTDFSREALVKLLAMNQEYTVLCLEHWAADVEKRFGHEVMLEVERDAWNDGIAPHLEVLRDEYLPTDEPEVLAAWKPEVPEGERPTYLGIFEPVPELAELCSKEELITMVLGSHEFLLQAIESWATQIVVRYGMDAMYSIQHEIWSMAILPAVKDLKAKHMGISGNTVADWMKDLQLDSTALPGKAFDCSFEMPEPDVGIYTFNRCVSPAQWEALGREDILEASCHAICPPSIIETTKMYNPNMKVEILAIPKRVDKENGVCCKWRFSMRDESDPEYVPVEITTKPSS